MTKHSEQILEHKQSRGVILRLWREWVSVYRSRIALALGLMVIVAATSSAYPALISEVFNRLQNNIYDSLYIVPIAIILLSAIRAISMYLQVLTVNKLALRVTTDIQKENDKPSYHG